MKQSIKVFQKIREHIPLKGSSIEELRESFAKLCRALEARQDINRDRIRINSFDAYWIYHEDTPKAPVILFFHGGAFMLGSTSDHIELISRLSDFSGLRILSIDYRLAPEHPYPAANDDCLDAYLWLLNNVCTAENIVLAGDSAGGTLALSTLLRLKDSGLPLPAGAYCMSPGTNMNFDYGSIKHNAISDWLMPDTFIGIKHLFLSGVNMAAPDASPVMADLSGLPPLFVQAGQKEMLLDDSIFLAEKAKLSGTDITLEVWEDMFHCWQLFSSELPEGSEALKSGARFIRKVLGIDNL